LAHSLGRHHSGGAADFLTVAHEDEGWDAVYGELHGVVSVLVHIDFADVEAFALQLRDNRPHRPACPAPIGVENEHFSLSQIRVDGLGLRPLSRDQGHGDAQHEHAGNECLHTQTYIMARAGEEMSGFTPGNRDHS